VLLASGGSSQALSVWKRAFRNSSCKNLNWFSFTRFALLNVQSGPWKLLSYLQFDVLVLANEKMAKTVFPVPNHLEAYSVLKTSCSLMFYHPPSHWPTASVFMCLTGVNRFNSLLQIIYFQSCFCLLILEKNNFKGFVVSLVQAFLRCFRDPIRVSRIENRAPRMTEIGYL